MASHPLAASPRPARRGKSPARAPTSPPPPPAITFRASPAAAAILSARPPLEVTAPPGPVGRQRAGTAAAPPPLRPAGGCSSVVVRHRCPPSVLWVSLGTAPSEQPRQGEIAEGFGAPQARGVRPGFGGCAARWRRRLCLAQGQTKWLSSGKPAGRGLCGGLDPAPACFARHRSSDKLPAALGLLGAVRAGGGEACGAAAPLSGSPHVPPAAPTPSSLPTRVL